MTWALLTVWGYSSPVLREKRAGQADVQGFLEKYGYLDNEHHMHNAAELRVAVREFQWLSHLPVTGRLDGATLEKMTSPRCGVKDSTNQRPWAERVKSNLNGGIHSSRGQHLRKKRYTQTGSDKWYKRHLTYRIMNWPRHLSQRAVRAAVQTAFQLWSNVSGLVFQEVLLDAPTDIRLAFYQGEHNDGSGNAFDGPGGALAHAFFPCRGEAHFDMAERWSLGGLKGHNLFLVTAHEIGHTLGLEHSPVRNALMSPYYKKLGRTVLLSWDDINAVQQLYGKPPSGRLEQLPGEALSWVIQDWEKAHSADNRPHYCTGVFDAITMDQDHTVLVFRGNFFWTVTRIGAVSPATPLQQRWAELPLAIEAAAFSPLDKKFYFFKGKRLWRYSGSTLDTGFPRKSSELGLPHHPDTAFFYAPLGHLVVFKGTRYFVLNLNTLRSEPYYPRGLSDWKGIPRAANGAVPTADGRIYFFREQRFWRFDPKKLRVTGSGQWPKELEWIGCHRTISNEVEEHP